MSRPATRPRGGRARRLGDAAAAAQAFARPALTQLPVKHVRAASGQPCQHLFEHGVSVRARRASVDLVRRRAHTAASGRRCGRSGASAIRVRAPSGEKRSAKALRRRIVAHVEGPDHAALAEVLDAVVRASGASACGQCARRASRLRSSTSSSSKRSQRRQRRAAGQRDCRCRNANAESRAPRRRRRRPRRCASRVITSDSGR